MYEWSLYLFPPLNNVNDCACFKEQNISILVFENLIKQKLSSIKCLKVVGTQNVIWLFFFITSRIPLPIIPSSL